MYNIYKKSPKNIDFETFKCLLDIEKRVDYSAGNRVNNQIHGRSVIRDIILQKLGQETKKRTDLVKRKGEQANTRTFDIRIRRLNELREMIDNLEKGIVPSPLIQSGVEAAENITTSQINGRIETIKSEIEQERILADLGDVIDFIDPDLLQDARFIEFLRRYKLETQEQLERLENAYRKQELGDKSIEPVDGTDFIDGIY